MRISNQTLKDKAENSKDGSFDKRYKLATNHMWGYMELWQKKMIFLQIKRR